MMCMAKDTCRFVERHTFQRWNFPPDGVVRGEQGLSYTGLFRKDDTWYEAEVLQGRDNTFITFTRCADLPCDQDRHLHVAATIFGELDHGSSGDRASESKLFLARMVGEEYRNEYQGELDAMLLFVNSEMLPRDWPQDSGQ